MKRLLAGITAAVCLLASAAGYADVGADTGLYYAAEENFDAKKRLELRLNGGTDVSNSFLSIYGAGLGLHWLIDPTVSVGLEGTVYASHKKGSAETLADEMKTMGYDMHAVAPMHSASAVFRITPLSGMVNFFSKSIVKVDISALARVGGIRYQVVGWGPSAGIGLETVIGFTPTFGWNIAFNMNYEKPGTTDWLWRAGVVTGPTLRF